MIEYPICVKCLEWLFLYLNKGATKATLWASPLLDVTYFLKTEGVESLDSISDFPVLLVKVYTLFSAVLAPLINV